MHVNEHTHDFTAWYGDGADGSCPNAEQWARLFGLPADRPVTLVNLFKLRDVAVYPDENGISGADAFARYSSVSIPAMQRAGGSFHYAGPHRGAFLGEEEDWDIVAIGTYPNLDCLIALYADPDYRAVFHHRTAACARQSVFVCAD